MNLNRRFEGKEFGDVAWCEGDSETVSDERGIQLKCKRMVARKISCQR